jgi:hypothetical protein
MHSLRELAHAIEEGMPLEQRFTVRTISIPEPGNYPPKADRLGKSKLISPKIPVAISPLP